MRIFIFNTSDVITKSLIPKSIPTCLLVIGNTELLLHSYVTLTKYLPLGTLDIVAFLILPFIFLCTFAFTNPSFGNLILLLL